MELFRPVGLRELELIFKSGMKEFPPRLPDQPIFYPVLNREYAAQIARDWNTKDFLSGHAGFVLRFEMNPFYIKKFTIQTVGGHVHQELWVPAVELPEFNRNIIGKIEVLESFAGTACSLKLDPDLHLPRTWLETARSAEQQKYKK